MKHLAWCDKGTIAENDRLNGNIHPRTGKPMSSHQAFLIDMSTYNGVRNVRKVRQKGQIYLVGVEKGLTPIPASWGTVPGNSLSTEVDHSKYHVKNSYGLQVNNNTKMMQLQCKL